MNKLIATGALALLMSSCGSAQNSEEAKVKGKIPENVKTAFQKQFPKVKDVDWEKEGANYEASFENSDEETSVVIDSKGKILETETEMDSSTLPEAILTYLDTNYKGKKVKEAAKIVLSNGTIHYEAEVNNVDLIFDSNGVFIKEMKD